MCRLLSLSGHLCCCSAQSSGRRRVHNVVKLYWQMDYLVSIIWAIWIPLFMIHNWPATTDWYWRIGAVPLGVDGSNATTSLDVYFKRALFVVVRQTELDVASHRILAVVRITSIAVDARDALFARLHTTRATTVILANWHKSSPGARAQWSTSGSGGQRSRS